MIARRLRAWMSIAFPLVLVFSLLSPALTLSQESPPDDGTPVVDAVNVDPAVKEIVEPGDDGVEDEETPTEVTTEVATDKPTVVPQTGEAASTQEAVTLSGVVPGASPSVEFSLLQGFVGTTVDFVVSDFPPSSQLQVIQTDPFANQRLVTTSSATDANGDADGSFQIPPTNGSEFHTFRIAVGWVQGNPPTELFSLSPGTFTVLPQLLAEPGVFQVGETVDFTLTGGPFITAHHPVFWYQGTDQKSAGTLNLSPGLSGTTNFQRTVPSFATNGMNVVEVMGMQTHVQVSNSAAPPQVDLSTTRTTVNNNVQWDAFGFNPNSVFTVTWRRPGGSTLQMAVTSTNATGEASGTFKVPATEGGNANSIRFTAGSTTITLAFDVAPRIKLIPGQGVRGGTVEVSLRGYSKNESVRIRWKIGSSFVLITTRTMSNTGSANFNITVPNNAPIGANSVRADGTIWRQQTNAFIVTG